MLYVRSYEDSPAPFRGDAGGGQRLMRAGEHGLHMGLALSVLPLSGSTAAFAAAWAGAPAASTDPPAVNGERAINRITAECRAKHGNRQRDACRPSLQRVSLRRSPVRTCGC